MTNVLICNAGSSSIKFSLIRAERERTLADVEIEWTAEAASMTVRRDAQPDMRKQLALRSHTDAVVRVLSELQLGESAPSAMREQVSAVGHRVVHGGERYTAAVLIDSRVQHEINRKSTGWPSWRHCTTRPAFKSLPQSSASCPACRRWPHSTPHFTLRLPKRRERIRCRTVGPPIGDFAATGSTG
jgi:hypothetical protein